MAQPGGLFSFGQPQQQQQAQQQATPFSFGAKPAAAPANPTFGGGGFTFANPAAQPLLQQQQPQQQQQPATAFSFGNPAAGQQMQQPQPTAPTAGTGLFGFSAGSNATAPGQAAAPSTFGFGTQAAQVVQPQASAGTGTGFGFGLGQTNQPTLGGTSTFGAPAAGTATGFGFGTATAAAAPVAAPAAGAFSFGSTPAAAAGTGTVPGAATTFGFGSTPQQPQAQAAPAQTASVAPFSFGTKLGAPAAAATSAPTGFSFGTPAASTAPTLTLGGLGTGIGTGTAPGTGTGLFGSVGAATTTAPTLGLGTGTGLGLGAGTSLFGTPATNVATSSAAPTFGGGLFGTSGATTTAGAATTPFSFGTKLGTPGLATAQPAASTATGFSFGGFGGLGTLGQTPASAAATTATTAPADSTPSTGMGGVPKYATTGSESSFAFGGVSGDGKTENRAIQELPLPPEMLVLVEELKNQIKSDKLKFTELNRTNNDPMVAKVSDEIEEIRNSATALANMIQKQTSNCETIRSLIHEGLMTAEMANQTRETPPGAQADHNTPIQYFFRLVDNFRERMSIILREIEKAESSLSYVLSAHSSFTSEELYNVLKASRDDVIVLSAKVQVLHEEVIRTTEAHRNLQHYLVGETTEFSSTSGTPTPTTSGSATFGSAFGTGVGIGIGAGTGTGSAALGKHISFGKTYTYPYQSQYQFPNLLDKEKESDYSKINLLFQNKLVEPPKIAGMHPTSPSVKTSPPGMSAFSSTRMERPPLAGIGHKSSDSLFYPSHALFQTQQSTILSQTQMGTTNPSSPNISLKRSKR